MVPGAGVEPARLAAEDFESSESTNFTTRAMLVLCYVSLFLSSKKVLVYMPCPTNRSLSAASLPQSVIIRTSDWELSTRVDGYVIHRASVMHRAIGPPVPLTFRGR